MLWVHTIMQRVLHSLSLHSLKVLLLLQTVFLSLWWISDGCTPSAASDLIIMRCFTLTDTFGSLISLVELRQDLTRSQLPEREGRETISPFQGVHRCGPGGSMRSCHAAGPGSILGRDKFPGWDFSGFFLTCKTNVGKLKAPKVPEYHLAIIITHHSLRAPMTWNVDAP